MYGASSMMKRWAGKDDRGLGWLEAHGAMEIYSHYLAQDSVIRASCEDYRAGAEEDIQLQELDQASERKLSIPTLILYSADYLGSRYDVQNIWNQWSVNSSKVFVLAIGGGVGHFIAEERPEDSASSVTSFLKYLNDTPRKSGPPP
jgi:pimeloyl-ACP methyl ester carboxylesterase